MGRNSIKLELIEKESTRLLTYQKRKKSLLKKISEFSILCGVDAFLIIFGPKLKDQQLKLDVVFPSNPDEARKVVDRYKKSDVAKRTYTVCDYYSEKIKKLELDISKLRKKVCVNKYPTWNQYLDSFSEGELRLLAARLDSKIDAADKKINLLKQNQNSVMLLHVPESTIPVGFEKGESSSLNLDYYSSGMQAFSGSSWKISGGSLIEKKPMEVENINSLGTWQNQYFENSNLSRNLDSVRMINFPHDYSVGSDWDLIWPRMVFPVSSLPCQVRPPQ